MLLAAVSPFPPSPLLMARFGLHAIRSAASLSRSVFAGEHARGLFAGCAAHSFGDLEDWFTASFGIVLACAGHAVGWPVPKGGSQKLVDALTAYLKSLGGEVRTGERVTQLGALPQSDLVLFDTTPAAMVRIAGDALPPRYRRRAERFAVGPGVFKLDYALDGPVPWKAAACARAGTVHLGGTLAELCASERAVTQGQVPERPYVLVAQQSLFDPTRAPPGKHTLWAYCHVPNGCTTNMTSRIEDQLERFAPGFRDRVLARVEASPARFAEYNPNYVGGDICGGDIRGMQLFFRPMLKANPYSTPNPRLFLCSSSTPPGPGVHGMSGHAAAKAALRAGRARN
jgi:phytoene dehydrogenase-like protein